MKAFLNLLIINVIFSIIATLIPVAAVAEYSQVYIKIERYLAITGEINIRPYIKNADDYAGFRLVAVEVIAGALNETAIMSVEINNILQRPTLQLGQTIFNFQIIPDAEYYIGHGAEDIKLRTRNPAYIKSVNLILTR